MALFKIDENLPHAVKDLLVAGGHDALTVADQSLAGAVAGAIRVRWVPAQGPRARR